MSFAAEWTGAEATGIEAVLENVSGCPHRGRYRTWLGPVRLHSNAYSR